MTPGLCCLDLTAKVDADNGLKPMNCWIWNGTGSIRNWKPTAMLICPVVTTHDDADIGPK